MILKEQNILFLSRSTQHGGTENVIVQLCKIFKPYVNNIVVCTADGFDVSLLKKMGIKHYVIPDIENKSPFIICRIRRKLLEIIKNEKITVVHTHHRMAAFYAFILRSHFKFFINTCHNTFTDKRFFTRFIYKKAHLISCGEMVKKNLMDFYGFNDDEVKVIHNAIEPFVDQLEVIEELDRMKQAGNVLVGNVGRLSAQKGMEYFIKSLPEVLDRHSNVVYIIVGDGEDRVKLDQLAESLNVKSNIYFVGFRKDVRNIIAQLDFIVLSSLWEGLPLTPIEAYSVGKTVIATAVDGTVEIVQDGVDGCLVKPKDPSQMAERINYLIEHEDIREYYEKNAQKRYFEKFSFSRLREEYIMFYCCLDR